MDFFCNEDGTLCIKPAKYIAKMMDTYTHMFGAPPSTRVHSPAEANDHPKLDNLELLDTEGVQQYQLLLGMLQWIISIGYFNVQTAVMTLSFFRGCPQRGHLDRAKRIFGYIRKFDNVIIRVRTDIPDYSGLPEHYINWSTSVYGDCKEVLPFEAPVPLGRPVLTTTYVDANLIHNLLSGKSVTGILHLLNKTPIN